jgi:hypothetical protein
MVGLSLLGCPMTMTGTMTGAAARPTELPFTELQRLAPSIRVELRYATANNFTGKVLYPPEARCYLRASVAEALAAVATALQAEGWDSRCSTVTDRSGCSFSCGSWSTTSAMSPVRTKARATTEGQRWT